MTKQAYYAVYDRGDIFEVHGFDSRPERWLWIQQHPERGDTRMPSRYIYGVTSERARKLAGFSYASKKFDATVIWHHKESNHE